jgi:ATP-dependent Lon protease
MILENCDDMRDSRAIESGATGLLKILFPDRTPSQEDFYRFCVNPTLEMRQRVRDELCKLDREYTPISMRSAYPDEFQIRHRKPQFVDPNTIDFGELSQQSESEAESEDEA